MSKPASPPKTFSFTVNFPAQGLVADDELGRWMDDHGVSVDFNCMLGMYTATVSWKKLHSYNDTDGEHAEHWTISRRDRVLGIAISNALRAAYEKTQVSP